MTTPEFDFVRGDATGMSIPAHGAALRSAGEAFLTSAFRTFGSLSPTNRVTWITRCDKCSGGSTGEKLFLSVEYAFQEPGLHTELFVKFSRDFNDPIRDNRGKHEMESEVRFAALSRLPGFPINVPVAYFADYHHESRTGLLITEQIPFGVGAVEPHHVKCLDHDLADPLAHYQTIVKALARIAAAHKSGRLAPDLETRFPYDPVTAAAANRVVYNQHQVRDLISQYVDFARRCPQLLPAPIVSPGFIAKLARQAERFLENEAAIRRFLQSNSDLIALCHWNAQIDNAWFWRDSHGAMQCGLIDWGHVSQMNVAFSLWGCLSGAGLDIWERHFDGLLQLFADEFHAHGGPAIPVSELELHLLLYAALMFLTYFIESPSRILFRLPEAAAATGPLDPIFRASDPARNNLHILSVVLSLWQARDFEALLDRVSLSEGLLSSRGLSE
jgi:hypothetical protein